MRITPAERCLLASCWLSKISLSSCQSSSCTTLPSDLDKPRLNFLPYSVSKVVKLNIPRGGRLCFGMLQPHQTWSSGSDAHVLDVSAFWSQISEYDGSSVTYWAHTPHISLLEFTGSSQKVLSDVTWFAACVCSSSSGDVQSVEPQQKYYRKKIKWLTFLSTHTWSDWATMSEVKCNTMTFSCSE